MPRSPLEPKEAASPLSFFTYPSLMKFLCSVSSTIRTHRILRQPGSHKSTFPNEPDLASRLSLSPPVALPTVLFSVPGDDTQGMF